MISVQFLVVTYAVLYAGAFAYGAQVSRPNIQRQRIDQLPKLSDTLAVAKSPFEPITIAVSRTSGEESMPSSVVPATIPPTTSTERKQSTRAAQDFEQEKDVSSTGNQNESTQADSRSTSIESAESTTAIEVGETESSTAPTETELPTTTVKLELDRLATTEAPTTQAPTSSSTTLTPEPEITTSSVESASSTEDTLDDSKISTSTGTTESTTTSTTTPEPTTTSTTEAPTKTTTTTPVPTTTELATEPAKVAEPTSEKATETEAPKAQTESLPEPEKEKEQPLSTTASPAPTTTTPDLSSTPTDGAGEESAKPTEPPKEPKVFCNHLPTYDSEEIQRVFREETTYKNGTIKGKFTYINFDQRYRLVHYTRLPYGPVKIDLVEELGRPDQANRSTPAAAPSSEIPNAVLQLRNILPNSLFGFPFLGPNVASNRPTEHRVGEQDTVNKYFYSTDSIATPNLLSPSVPVSLLPGQGRLSQPINAPAADTLGQSFVDSLPAPQVGVNPKFKESEKVTEQASLNTQPFVLATPSNNMQFQYAIASHASQAGESSRHPGLIYSNLAQPQHQYQYSPLPVYAFPQPHYYPTARQAAIVTPASNKLKYEQTSSEGSTGMARTFSGHQTHQPHSHEHYMAPFMFAPPAASRNDQPESSRLRLKVKTSKALSQESSGVKFAQLRAANNQQHYQPAVSPANRVHRPQRQRAGKQNQELRATVNSSPVVYHVLRSPVGRVYTIPQYSQSHAIAFDHDD